MASSSPDSAADPALARWLGAAEPAQADRALAELIEKSAMPVVLQTLGRKVGGFGRGSAASDDSQEVVSRVREQLVRAARRARDPAAAPIRDYAGYVATVTRTVWAEYLREKYPGRTMLSYRLRYLLENRTGQTGFAIWGPVGADAICGFAGWRNAPPAPAEALRCLLINPGLADGLDGTAASTSLPDIVARTLRALGGPVSFHDLLAIIADRLGINEAPESLETSHEVGALPTDPSPGPEDMLRWKEYLAWLWQEIGRLPLRQRLAFLLHSTAAHDLEYGGVAGVRQQAALLEMRPETFVEHWSRLPLDDLTIAAMLGVTRQQVINLRKVARGTLGAAWRKWIDRAPAFKIVSHNESFSPSAL